jgi:hypothetical protein
MMILVYANFTARYLIQMLPQRLILIKTSIKQSDLNPLVLGIKIHLWYQEERSVTSLVLHHCRINSPTQFIIRCGCFDLTSNSFNNHNIFPTVSNTSLTQLYVLVQTH